jgi:hypothetical protein
MDKFDQTVKSLMAVSLRERTTKIETLKSMCPCPGCPTYNACAKNAKEMLFCLIGKSFHCITQDKGCICPSCPLAKDAGITLDRFCLKGSEFEQRYLKMLR